MELDQTLDLQTQDGPLPGIPLAPRNGSHPEGADAAAPVPAAEGAGICMPCLIARAAIMLVLAGALVALLVIERRKAAQQGAPKSE